MPGDDQYKFRERAKALVDRWHGVLNAGKPPGEKEANGDVGAMYMERGVKDEENVTEGTKNLNLNAGAGANGNGAFS